MTNWVPATVLVAHLDGEAVVLEMDRKRYFRLNETGQAIWRALEAGRSREAAVDALVQAYDIDAATAGAAMDRFIADLQGAGLVRSGTGS